MKTKIVLFIGKLVDGFIKNLHFACEFALKMVQIILRIMVVFARIIAVACP